MNIKLKQIISVFLCVFLFISVFNLPIFVSADEKSDLQADIAKLQAQAQELEKNLKDLKKNTNDKKAILNAVQKKIANTQAQIKRCNDEINGINAKIKANKDEINKANASIEQNKLEFKKRLRAIHMSNTGSSIQVLLGADSFADFLQLSQLTSSVSKRDKKMIEDLAAVIKGLEEKNKENEKLLESQVAIKDQVLKAQQELQAEEAEAAKYYNEAKAEQDDTQSDIDNIEDLIEEKRAAINRIANGGSSYNDRINPNTGFMWPVPGHYRLSSGWGMRWGRMHYGIDINDGSIYQAPIVAIADGTIYETYTACPHRDKKSRCRCGSGWGNHVAINHGEMTNIDGAVYKAMYAHMDYLAAGMYVGKEVKQGEVIGYVGTTGDSTGYHLHFGLYRNGGWVNPSNYL